LLFGLYVQFHGDFGPGGGFQAGVIFAAGLILYGLIFGLDTLQRVFTPFAVEICMAAGLILYAGTGLVSFLKNLNYLDYAVFGSHGQHYGILLIEAGVGITVASTMLMIYYAFAGRGRL
jgi:multicomponent Na+:H+ antiporter subunit B